MALLGFFADQIISMLLSEVAGQIGIQIQDGDRAEIDEITSQISKVDNKLEMIPLRSGFQHLQIGKFDMALGEFVRAISANPHNAVAKLCMSILLYREGQQQPALNYFRQAIAMNPFVSMPPFIQASKIFSFLNTHPSSSTEIQPAKSFFWTQTLQEKQVLQSIPMAEHLLAPGHWLPTTGIAHDLLTEKITRTGPILAASYGGRYLAILWQLIEGPEKTSIISLFNMESGHYTWSLRAAEKQLQFVSNDYLVLSSNSREETYELYDCETGSMLLSMSKSHYEASFCPYSMQIQKMDEYQRSNVVMNEEADFLAQGQLAYKTEAEQKLSRQNFLENQPVFVKTFEDPYVLSDPFKVSPYHVKINNLWEYKNSPRGYRGFSVRAESLNCSSKVNNLLQPKNG